MRISRFVLPFFAALSLAMPSYAQEEKKPEAVVEKMSVKFVRGITNMMTSVVELPKQTYITARDEGAVGYVVGPLKGIGMIVIRALGGAAETAFFLVPQPGYYDPVLDPAYVWQGWEPKRAEFMNKEENKQNISSLEKEE
jgi:putative exosortase-associated protein (TIGR04073 family)